MATFAERLRQLRESARLSREELGSRIGVTASAVGLYETGKREPNFATTMRLANFFQVTIDYLMGRSAEPCPPLPEGAYPAGPLVAVPILGTIRAGMPIYAAQHIVGYEHTPIEEVAGGEYFYLRVVGDSMTGDGILPDSLVLVRRQEEIGNGEIAVVIDTDGEATVKRVRFVDNHLILYASNPNYQPLVHDLRDVRIIGKVVKAEVTFS